MIPVGLNHISNQQVEQLTVAGVIGAAGAAVTVITAQERELGPERGLVAILHQHVEGPPALDNLQTLETVTVNAVST